jgi:hypothetical protein
VIPFVNADLSIPDDAKCQEASPFSKGMYLACSQKATTIVDNGDSRPYYMCAGCADHNIRHRGAKLLAALHQKHP